MALKIGIKEDKLLDQGVPLEVVLATTFGEIPSHIPGRLSADSAEVSSTFQDLFLDIKIGAETMRRKNRELFFGTTRAAHELGKIYINMLEVLEQVKKHLERSDKKVLLSNFMQNLDSVIDTIDTHFKDSIAYGNRHPAAFTTHAAISARELVQFLVPDTLAIRGLSNTWQGLAPYV